MPSVLADPRFTTQEQALGGFVAVVLWLTSVSLLVALTAWTAPLA
ncbi:MAG: hypothetical protein U1D55_03180 [Phycisphaerae bacterium]